MKIKGPFGEIEVIGGKLVKGESPCKSCEHQFTCQFEERCGAKFDGWESVSDNPKPENPAFVKCKDCGNVLDRGLCLNCHMRKLQPPSGAIVPKRPKVVQLHKLEVIGKYDKAVVTLDGKEVTCRSLTFNCGVGECPTVSMELLCDEFHIDYEEFSPREEL